MLYPLDGTVVAVSRDDVHRFSKIQHAAVTLIQHRGVQDDAHAGRFVKHRYLAQRTPRLSNNRQVHLIPSELFADLARLGFKITSGALGENITTSGIDLHVLPLGSLVRLGQNAVIRLTGLRTPCSYLDRFQKGLKRAVIVKAEPRFRAGVFGVVCTSGDVVKGDPIHLTLPERPWRHLPAL